MSARACEGFICTRTHRARERNALRGVRACGREERRTREDGENRHCGGYVRSASFCSIEVHAVLGSGSTSPARPYAVGLKVRRQPYKEVTRGVVSCQLSGRTCRDDCSPVRHRHGHLPIRDCKLDYAAEVFHWLGTLPERLTIVAKSLAFGAGQTCRDRYDPLGRMTIERRRNLSMGARVYRDSHIDLASHCLVGSEHQKKICRRDWHRQARHKKVCPVQVNKGPSDSCSIAQERQ